MGVLRETLDRIKAKRNELGKRAAKKAAEVALDQTAKVAGRAVDAAGKAIERVLFGDSSEDATGKEEPDAAPPDPFAKLKAEEAAKKRRAGR